MIKLLMDQQYTVVKPEMQAPTRQNPPLIADLNSRDSFLLAFINARLPARFRRHMGASDILQSVLFAVSRRQQSFRGSSEAEFRAWVFQIAQRKIIDGLRRYRTRTGQPQTGCRSRLQGIEPETPSMRASIREDAKALLDAVEQLPADLREIVTMRYARSMTFEEISSELRIPVTTCRRRWLEGCEILRQQLSDLLP